MVSQITDRILPLLQEWQNRLLDPVYVCLYLDAIHLKVRRDGRVQNTAIYTCLGVNLQGEKFLLGLWIGDGEGARFWQGVLTDLKNRGVETVHRQMRKVTKTKGAFPSEEAALKQLFLNLRLVERKWATALPYWQDVLNYLMVSHHERIVLCLK